MTIVLFVGFAQFQDVQYTGSRVQGVTHQIMRADGELLLTGGGDMQVRIGGDLNPSLRARVNANDEQNMNLTGVLTNLRGSLQLYGGALGSIALNYGSVWNDNDAKETRALDPFTSTLGMASGGPVDSLDLWINGAPDCAQRLHDAAREAEKNGILGHGFAQLGDQLRIRQGASSLFRGQDGIGSVRHSRISRESICGACRFVSSS